MRLIDFSCNCDKEAVMYGKLQTSNGGVVIIEWSLLVALYSIYWRCAIYRSWD